MGHDVEAAPLDHRIELAEVRPISLLLGPILEEQVPRRASRDVESVYDVNRSENEVERNLVRQPIEGIGPLGPVFELDSEANVEVG